MNIEVLKVMKKQYLTRNGLKDLKKEYKKALEKFKVIKEQYQQALSYGDRSENSELDQVKQDKRILERKIRGMENTLKTAEIVKEDCDNKDQATIGCKITIKNIKTKDQKEYQIVGVSEADPLKGKISNESPIGRAFLGKEPGEIVSVNTPSGEIGYKIVEIQ